VKKTYLFIFEDGTIWKGSKYSEEDLEYCDNGVLQIIDISQQNDPVEYIDGIWQTIEEIK